MVAAFALAHGGRAASIAVLRGVCRGLIGFAAFCYAVALLLPRSEVWQAFLAASALTLALQAVRRLVSV